MLQRLPVALAQVRAHNTHVRVSSRIFDKLYTHCIKQNKPQNKYTILN